VGRPHASWEKVSSPRMAPHVVLAVRMAEEGRMERV